MSKVLAYVVEAPGQMRPREFPRPIIGSDDLLLRIERVSVCGSDPAHYRGERLNPVSPIILGHEVVAHRITVPVSLSFLKKKNLMEWK